ncbi:MAG: hypothetical protein N3E45_05130 [Oscillatoriaceae bacterium SKW80]|nr:hypothetical protein [Oscillatoriaceae bacterium SKYG93]MCX8120197.1 hypothetical protein [Oscillatoriaceae bacterium SKW80]MDW8453123.1 hypothetical protein [Oscillatoriaceae cyanobacterium SKYGB_i_bin93]HIK28965.1 hypothetical protein [Oscillatoriaceae cyanobacterium M7585_C2015_266]
MQPASAQSTPISEIISHIWCSGCITRAHRYGLMSALLEGWLTPEEYNAIDRLLHAVRRGWLKIVD